MRLLVVEDEQDLAAAIARGLRRHGYAVDIANGATVAEEKLRGNGYDLAILDWNLGDGSGLELCRRMVAGDLPTLEARRPRVLLLTARDDIDDRVAGLDAGADDYLVKPFAFAELAARARALLRRDETPDPVIQIGDLSLDPARFVARTRWRSPQLDQQGVFPPRVPDETRRRGDGSGKASRACLGRDG